MNRAQIIIRLAGLPNSQWMSAVARVRWLYLRWGVEAFDFKDMPPDVAEFLRKEPPEEVWQRLRVAVTRKRRADAVRQRRLVQKETTVKRRTYNREYMQAYRKKHGQRTQVG